MKNLVSGAVATLLLALMSPAYAGNTVPSEPPGVKEVRTLYQSMLPRYIESPDSTSIDAPPTVTLNSSLLSASGAGGDFSVKCTFDVQSKMPVLRFCRAKTEESNLQPKTEEFVFDPAGELVFALESRPFGSNPATHSQENRFYFAKGKLIHSTSKYSTDGKSAVVQGPGAKGVEKVRLSEKKLRRLIEAQSALQTP